jgi:hypothetical protein
MKAPIVGKSASRAVYGPDMRAGDGAPNGFGPAPSNLFSSTRQPMSPKTANSRSRKRHEASFAASRLEGACGAKKPVVWSWI